MISLPRLLNRKKIDADEPEPGRSANDEVDAHHFVEEGRSQEEIAASFMCSATSPCSEELIEVCREQVLRSPNHAGAYLRLGIVLLEAGLEEQAAAALVKATRLGKDAGLSSAHCAPAASALGAALVCQGKRQEAIGEFRQAQRLLMSTTDFAPIALKQALVAFKRGEFAQAAERVKQIVETGADSELIGTDRALAHCTIGCSLVAQGARFECGAYDEFAQTYTLLRVNYNVR